MNTSRPHDPFDRGSAPSALLLTLLLGWSCTVAGCSRADSGAPPPAPAPLADVCGDGRVSGSEQCDDGNGDDADGCLDTCFTPVHWIRSDPHIHGRGCAGERLAPEQLLAVSSARGIEVTAGLVWGVGFRTERGYFSGNDDPSSQPDSLLHYDLEVSHFAAERTGHLVLLGLHSIDFSPRPFDAPSSGIPVLDWALGQGPRVVAGMAHGQFWPAHGFPSPPVDCCTPWDFPVEAIRGRLAFLETERREIGPPLDAGTARLWRSVLNAGARVAIAGASDYPCIHHFMTNDTPRTDVMVDGELTYDSWLDAFRAGRTSVVVGGSGTHLNLRVAGALPGDELSAQPGEPLPLSIETISVEPAPVVVSVNGVPTLTVPMDAGVQAEAATLQLDESAWISASNPWATTSPIYVIVGGRPIRGAVGDICELRRYVDHLSGLVSSGRLNLGSERGLALETYDAVARELDVRIAEAGGSGC